MYRTYLSGVLRKWEKGRSNLIFWSIGSIPGPYTYWILLKLCDTLLKVKSVSFSVLSDSFWPHGLYVACQAPLSMEFSRQEYWNGLPCPSSGDLPDAGIKPRSSALQADSLLSEPPGKPKLDGILSLLNMRKLGRRRSIIWSMCPFVKW